MLGSGPISQRLSEMGVLSGHDIRVLRAAPLGDPLHVEVAGTYLAVRKREAALVVVEQLP